MIDVTGFSWMILAAILSAIPLIALGKYIESNEQDHHWLVTAFLAQIFVVIIYLILLRNKKMGIIYPIIKITSIVLVAIFGLLYFEQTVSTQQIVGIALGATSMIVLATC